MMTPSPNETACINTQVAGQNQPSRNLNYRKKQRVAMLILTNRSRCCLAVQPSIPLLTNYAGKLQPLKSWQSDRQQSEDKYLMHATGKKVVSTRKE
jgi:hypothetical protein